MATLTSNVVLRRAQEESRQKTRRLGARSANTEVEKVIQIITRAGTAIVGMQDFDIGVAAAVLLKVMWKCCELVTTWRWFSELISALFSKFEDRFKRVSRAANHK